MGRTEAGSGPARGAPPPAFMIGAQTRFLARPL